MVNSYLKNLVACQRILLLQSPIGYFFYSLKQWLTEMGCDVFKVNFNAGDRFFYPSSVENTVDFQGELQHFSAFLADFVHEHQIKAIVCFGDTRPYHLLAKAFCQQHSEVQFWAFEEGYFRPEYITLEKDGVNAYSTLPREAAFFLQAAENLPEPVQPKQVAKGFMPMARLAICYYLAAYFGRKDYPHYQHHRQLSLGYYLKLWTVSGIKRAYYYLRDRKFTQRLARGAFDEFFIVPLQVYDDSQVRVHCDYPDVAHFLDAVLASFVQYAPPHVKLVIKHHPMDRGFLNYESVINRYTAQNPSLAQRIFYVHDVPMPAILRKAKGMVTLNSTSGISALLHNVPVLTLGRASYDFAGLTYQGSLDRFWQDCYPPDPVVFEAYRKFHLHKTHLNGSYYNYVIFPPRFAS